MSKLIPLLMSSALVTLPASALAHENSDMPGIIHVTATAMADAVPDKASVTAGVMTEGPTAKDAMARNSEMMRNVFATLAAAGIPNQDVSTASLNLNPRYDYEDRRKGQPRITGYQANNRITVTTTDLDRTGVLIDAMLEAGVNNINGVNFVVSAPDAAQAQARTKAISKAHAKARTMAQAANVRLGRLLSMREGNVPGPVRYDEVVVTAARMDGASMAPPLSPGQREISATVTLSYAILD